MLDRLLAEGRVRRFKRQGGWVDPSSDPVRRSLIQAIGLPERREPMQTLLSSDRPLPLRSDEHENEVAR